MRYRQALPLVMILVVMVFSCGEEETTAPPETISIASYISRVYDADYIVGQEPPPPTGEGSVTVATRDSLVGRGSTFYLRVTHGTGVEDIILSVEDAVGYYVRTAHPESSTTKIAGFLMMANQNSFTMVCRARCEDGTVLKAATQNINVLSQESVKYYISGVEGATFVEDELPEPNRGPTITNITGDSIMISGGSAELTVSTFVPAQAVIIGVPNTFGYFRLPTQDLPGDVDITIFLAQTATPGFSISFITEEFGRPEYGSIASLTPALIAVGGGDVQVSLAFSPSQDLDLHLVEPTREEIYYGYPSSSAGGWLDLDSNAACHQDHVNNENITYAQTTPPSGEYIVRVDFWESCDGGGADFRVVTVIRGDVQIYRDDFTIFDESHGGQGSGREICRFTF